MLKFWDKFFELKLLKLSDINLHESTEEHRLKRVQRRIASENYLLNPVIVGRFNNEYILIDGANRYESLKRIGCELILCQIIDYKDRKVKLSTWNHIVHDLDVNDLIEFLELNQFEYKRVSLNSGVKSYLEDPRVVFVSGFDTGIHYIIFLSGVQKIFIAQIKKLTDLYFKNYKFERSDPGNDLPELNKLYHGKIVLIRFPKFRKRQIVYMSRNNLKVPSGLTRHRINNRVLHIKYELKYLRSADNLKNKTSQLSNFILEKTNLNKVRHYTESVIIFDE
jgi:hypothetical protein